MSKISHGDHFFVMFSVIMPFFNLTLEKNTDFVKNMTIKENIDYFVQKPSINQSMHFVVVFRSDRLAGSRP